MNDKLALIFIGESVRKVECSINSKPGFADAVRLSKQLYDQTTCNSYQRIPLDDKNDIFQISDSDTQLTIDRGTIKITEGSKQLTEEEVFNMINNFVFNKGHRVTFLSTIPNRKSKIRNRNKQRVLATGKKLEDE